MHPNVYIYVDFQNVPLNQQRAKSLIDFGNSRGTLRGQNIYFNSECEGQAQVPQKLQGLEFEFQDVPCKLKNSADDRLKSDLIDDLASKHPPNIIILVSGDGDFTNSMRLLQERGAEVFVFANRGNVKQDLKEIANEFYFIEELEPLLNQADLSEPHVPYHQALEYLTEVVKMATKESKQVGLAFIDRLMRDNFPSYRGVSSICKQDGKKFSKFKQFILAAAKDGIVQTQDIGNSLRVTPLLLN